MKVYQLGLVREVMALHIGQAIGNGIRRTLNPIGFVLMTLTFLYTLVFLGATNTIASTLIPANVQEQASIGVTFPVSMQVAGLLLLAGMLLGTVLIIAATRAFTRTPWTRGNISIDLFTRRIVRAVISVLIANIIVSLLVIIGFVLLIIPGLFLLVSFTFVLFAIGVEDTGPIGALRRSWQLTTGHRWRVFALVLIVGVGTSVLTSIGSVVSLVDPATGQIVTLLIAAVLGMMSYGILADAYIQLNPAANK